MRSNDENGVVPERINEDQLRMDQHPKGLELDFSEPVGELLFDPFRVWRMLLELVRSSFGV